ncbi:hypothetical protein DC3_22120 [Deinococcus cellulosilyticus NBRC 106333 = KACC 11606]|uniref:Uncharacterized protein n=1 Tax=Deinococcus cellulosilyticus (strain DSM 18568 / NBRC 106333 / KACC 11606 / 5516J-15) TaxID=1223518 RepID=A0A511N243_DEIC1|nr:hypothetical protein DC3_22120 [Deinococcus cellulosilyticus NBRC 106333 = KACC 11606]
MIAFRAKLRENAFAVHKGLGATETDKTDFFDVNTLRHKKTLYDKWPGLCRRGSQLVKAESRRPSATQRPSRSNRFDRRIGVKKPSGEHVIRAETEPRAESRE